jgi:hypothetical protein
VGERVTEFDYQPTKCGRSYRLVVVRKKSASRNGKWCSLNTSNTSSISLITPTTAQNRSRFLANQRCDQENVIEQLKNLKTDVNAMRMPVDDLLSNWTYMVMNALAWNLKAWYELLIPNRQRGLELLQMEFRRFLHLIALLPVQIVRSGGRIIYRLIGYKGWLKDFFATWECLRRMAPA